MRCARPLGVLRLRPGQAWRDAQPGFLFYTSNTAAAPNSREDPCGLCRKAILHMHTYHLRILIGARQVQKARRDGTHMLAQA